MAAQSEAEAEKIKHDPSGEYNHYTLFMKNTDFLPLMHRATFQEGVPSEEYMRVNRGLRRHPT